MDSEENQVEIPIRSENVKISNLLKKNEEKERIKKIMREQEERERSRAQLLEDEEENNIEENYVSMKI